MARFRVLFESIQVSAVKAARSATQPLKPMFRYNLQAMGLLQGGMVRIAGAVQIISLYFSSTNTSSSRTAHMVPLSPSSHVQSYFVQV